MVSTSMAYILILSPDRMTYTNSGEYFCNNIIADGFESKYNPHTFSHGSYLICHVMQLQLLRFASLLVLMSQ